MFQAPSSVVWKQGHDSISTEGMQDIPNDSFWIHCFVRRKWYENIQTDRGLDDTAIPQGEQSPAVGDPADGMPQVGILRVKCSSWTVIGSRPSGDLHLLRVGQAHQSKKVGAFSLVLDTSSMLKRIA